MNCDSVMLVWACIEFFRSETSSELRDDIVGQHFDITRGSEGLACIICITYVMNMMGPEDTCFLMCSNPEGNPRPLKPPPLKRVRKMHSFSPIPPIKEASILLARKLTNYASEIYRPIVNIVPALDPRYQIIDMTFETSLTARNELLLSLE